jgi:hypothetical protein
MLETILFHTVYFETHFISTFLNGNKSGGKVEWLMRQTSILKIASSMGLNPVRGQSLFP